MTADLGLGSNMGDRLAHLQAAVDALRAAGCRVLALSKVYETVPVGGPVQDDFLNAVVRVDTDLTPPELLDLARSIEGDAGRARTVRWGPRPVDVDILRYEDVTADDPELTLPHPRMWERVFVLVPLADVDASVDLSGVDRSGVREVPGALH